MAIKNLAVLSCLILNHFWTLIFCAFAPQKCMQTATYSFHPQFPRTLDLISKNCHSRLQNSCSVYLTQLQKNHWPIMVCLVCTFLQSGSNKSRFVIPGSTTLAQCSYTPWIPPMIDHEMLHGTKLYIACTSTDFYCIFNRISDGQFLARSATGCVYIYLT